jgi:hypothetical protein
LSKQLGIKYSYLINLNKKPAYAGFFTMLFHRSSVAHHRSSVAHHRSSVPPHRGSVPLHRGSVALLRDSVALLRDSVALLRDSVAQGVFNQLILNTKKGTFFLLPFFYHISTHARVNFLKNLT